MSFNNVISQPDQEELIAIRSGMDTLAWTVGDIANRNYEAVKNTTSLSYVCAAVGYYCGRSRNTVERWARAAEFYDEEWRKKYDGLLSMEHYISAMSYPDYEKRLEKAAYGGMNEEPESVDQMNAPVENDVTIIDNFPQPEDMRDDEQTPAQEVTGLFRIIDRIIKYWNLDERKLSKVKYAIELLREALGVVEPQ
jgi:hypothetical protein